MARAILSVTNAVVNKTKCLASWSTYSNEGNRQMTDNWLLWCQVCVMSGSDRKLKQDAGRARAWECYSRQKGCGSSIWAENWGDRPCQFLEVEPSRLRGQQAQKDRKWSWLDMLRDSKGATEDGAWWVVWRCTSRFCHQRGRQARACGVF